MGESTRVEDPASSSSSPAKNKPSIFIPPRVPMESLFTSGLTGAGFSPGPMTLVSSYFAEQSPFSFSQLLAMASPKPGSSFLLDANNISSNNSGNDNNDDGKSDLGVKKEKNDGYKRNRPVNLVINGSKNNNESPQMMQMEGLSQLFMVPPGLSPGGLLNSPGFLSPLQSPFGMSHQQALAHVTAQAAFSQSYMQMQAELLRSSTTTSQPEASMQETINPTPSEPESSKVESPEFSESDKKTIACVPSDKPASDGYNWRKYGQKHVKASECPRSYYKCTHLNCPVKKKVERSADGRISEIIYKGQHNHDPPQSNKRGKDGVCLDKASNPRINHGTVSHSHLQTATRVNELAFINSAEMEDSAVVVDDGDDDEPIAKRRSIETVPTMPVSSHHTVTESKIVVQTRSEVDLLDDGFKWRKYGQKVVKGNPYPRSYYRCTYAGCNVRKHVERSSADPKAVITTYEGKHNHEIPMGKYTTSNASAQQQLKTRRTVGKNQASVSREETDFENNDQIPMTLQLKQERVAA